MNHNKREEKIIDKIHVEWNKPCSSHSVHAGLSLLASRYALLRKTRGIYMISPLFIPRSTPSTCFHWSYFALSSLTGNTCLNVFDAAAVTRWASVGEDERVGWRADTVQGSKEKLLDKPTVMKKRKLEKMRRESLKTCQFCL